MFLRIRALAIKELLAVWRDGKSRFVITVPPLIQLFVFTFAATLEVRDVPVAIFNEDYGTAGRDLVARIQGSPNFSRMIYLGGEHEVIPVLDSGQALMVVRLGPDFTRSVVAGQPAKVQLLLDGRRSNTAQLAAGYASDIVSRYAVEIGATRPGAAQPPGMVVTRVWFNPNLEPTWATVPGLVAILTTLIGVMVTGLSVARERELGTFEQLLVSPLSPAEIIVGKTLPALLLGVGESSLMMLAGTLVIGVPFRGSLGLLYLSLVVYLAAVIGVGLFVSSLAKTQQQAILGSFVFMVPAILLSGFASPIENMPDWLQTVTLANPVRHFMVIVKGLFLKDMPAIEVLRNVWPLILIAATTLTTASWLFRRRME